MSRHINDLHPLVAKKAGHLIAACQVLGCPIFLTDTLRQPDAQDLLFAQGRSTPGRIVTSAEAWESWHQPWVQDAVSGLWKALAFDIGFRPPDDPETPEREDHHGVSWDGPWDLVGPMGEHLGLEWGGRWKGKKRDRPHFQDPLGRTLAYYRAERGV